MNLHRHCDTTITELGQERDRLRVDLEACTIDLARERERAEIAEHNLDRTTRASFSIQDNLAATIQGLRAELAAERATLAQVADRFGIDPEYVRATEV